MKKIKRTKKGRKNDKKRERYIKNTKMSKSQPDQPFNVVALSLLPISKSPCMPRHWEENAAALGSECRNIELVACLFRVLFPLFFFLSLSFFSFSALTV